MQSRIRHSARLSSDKIGSHLDEQTVVQASWAAFNRQQLPSHSLAKTVVCNGRVIHLRCSQLEEIKAARGLHVDDGTAAADKPLAEVLAERKKAKQDAFEEQWKQMKTGKNRPLDADELDFLDALAQQEARQLATMQQQEAAELEAYRLAVAAAAEAKAAAVAGAGEGADASADDAAAGAAGPGPGSNLILGRSGSGAAAAAAKLNSKTSAKAAVLVVKPVLKVKPKAAAGETAAANSSKRQRLDPSINSQQRQQQRTEDADAGAAGLIGLLGEYGSASDEDS